MSRLGPRFPTIEFDRKYIEERVLGHVIRVVGEIELAQDETEPPRTAPSAARRSFARSPGGLVKVEPICRRHDRLAAKDLLPPCELLQDLAMDAEWI